MKLKYNKLLVASVVFTVASFGLLVASLFTNNVTSSKPSSFFPEYRFPVENKEQNDEILIEKIVQLQEDGKDLRSPVYLTHHGYLLSKIANMKVNYRQHAYTINDICYKPHFAIFQELLTPGRLDNLPDYLQRLLLEVQRLSPCLIVTPLNCFNDSYRIHSGMSKWNEETDYLNRKLRNSYMDAIDEKDARPYVKSTYGPDLIKEWAYHMLQLPSRPLSNFSKSDLSSRIDFWLSSIKPQKKLCAGKSGSCDRNLDSEHYFNICMTIQQVNDFDERQKLFGLEEGDQEFTTRLDCVEDREKFIEWMQERELRRMLKDIVPNAEMSSHMDVSGKSCDGIFHDSGSSGLELFNGARGFGNTTNPFDTMMTEIGLMTPENILKAMHYSDYVNGFESVWTIDRAEELLKEFRSALQGEVQNFNRNLPSRFIQVTTQIATDKAEEINEEQTIHSTMYFVLGGSLLLITLFSIFVFSENFIFSITMFLLRSAVTAILFSILCKSDGIILIDYNLLSYYIFHIIINLVLTTRITFLRERIQGCIQSRRGFTKSNFSSLGSVPVDSIKEGSDVRQVRYVLAQYTDYQVAVDAYSDESFEKLPKFWILLSTLFVPIIGLYWFFIDSDIQKICIVLLPSFVIAAYEELRIKNGLLGDRKEMKEINRGLEIQTERLYSERSYVNIFAGKASSTEEKSHHKSNEADVEKGSKCLYELPKRSYDASQIMAYPNAFCRLFRFNTFGLCFKLGNVHIGGLVVIAFAALFILLSAFLLFIPVQRCTLQRGSADFGVKEDGLFIEFSLENVSSSWDNINTVLDQFNAEIDSIGSLRTISNWKKSFDRYEGRLNQNESNLSGIDRYLKWMEKEPISWSLTAPLTKSSRKSVVSNPFQFRFGYEIDSSQESTVIETVEKIDSLLNKYSKTLSSPKAVGVLYEHYHQTAVVWNSFAQHQLLAAAVLSAFFALIVLVFSVQPTLLSTLVFTFFVVGTRLETAAVVSIFSIEHHEVYINLAVLIGFLVAWTPYCDLARFRARCLYKNQTRTSPELGPHRRIRYPFIAAVDTTQVFAILLSASVILALVAVFVPRFNFFLLTTIIFISTLLIAFANSIAIIITTNRMFEHEVRHYYHGQMGSMSASERVIDLSRRRLIQTENIEIPMDEFSIRPVENDSKFFGPPPTHPSTSRKEEDEQDADEETAEEINRQLLTVDDVPIQSADHTQRAATMPEPIIRPFSDAQPYMASGCMPNLFIISGAPMDATHGVLPRKSDVVPKTEDGEPSGLGGHHEDDDSYPSSGDDSGDSDKEREEVATGFAARPAEKKVKDEVVPEDPNVPGPSNRRPEEPTSAASNPDASLPSFEIRFREPHLHELPSMNYRMNGRNSIAEPPTMEEYYQQYSNPNCPDHPRTNQYPADFDRAMVGYCEDHYWFYNQYRLPEGLGMPPRPFDWEQIRQLHPPPPAIDPNYVAPPGRPCIPIPPEAQELWERRHGDSPARGSPDDTPGL